MNDKASNSPRVQRRMRDKRLSYSNIARSTIDYKDTVNSLNELYSDKIDKLKLKNEKPRRVYLVYVLGILFTMVSLCRGKGARGQV